MNITQYKPVTEKDIFSIIDTPNNREDVYVLWQQLVSIVNIQNASFIATGKILKMFRDQELYKELDYPSFNQFISSEELSFSRDRAYMCIRIYEYYIEELKLEPDFINQVGIAKLSLMLRKVKGLDKQEVVRQLVDARDSRVDDLRREVKKELDKSGKPQVYFSEELGRWFIGYYDDTCYLKSLGSFNEKD